MVSGNQYLFITKHNGVYKGNEITAEAYRRFETGSLIIIDLNTMQGLSDDDEWIDVEDWKW